ncbi:MAG: L-ribulose-5-phosphate 3-epimerase [Streptococcaceae bacterium]|jgi:hexulose-6-phosphate isomerase|nr:L-ribulose-5-phosphate 3-epimerase [Streptococcaceae bacterium]
MATLGIYEKALPKEMPWLKRLALAKKFGFDFVEMSIDESDGRLERLDWSTEEIERLRQTEVLTKMPISTICLSAHRRFPLGSKDRRTRLNALIIMEKCINLACCLGVRTIQIAGYDVYYEKKSVSSRAYFLENLKKCVSMSEEKGVMLSLEIMDDPFMNSISKFLKIKEQIKSPYLQVYPDLGNLSAWPENDVAAELESGIDFISNIHLKDTLSVSKDFPGKFKKVPFGSGCVDFTGCFKTLKAQGYNGSFVIEMWNEESGQPEKELEKAKQYLLPKLKEVGYFV